ncbi:MULTISPECIES: hypothetical protein [unclassified Sulfitobacter]|uniref:hypothetical protein n=1 Tax=unclassified Sulfitobacter TaxID=196795 RepID=UPI0023E158E3|nr:MULTISPECIES: hypothetical protein [unclassified Sulfitobacter]
MKKMIIAMLALSVLFGCKDRSPTADNIEQGYLNGIEADRAVALAQYGSIEDMPVGLQFSLRMRAKNVELTSCDEHPTDVGYLNDSETVLAGPCAGLDQDAFLQERAHGSLDGGLSKLGVSLDRAL